MGVLPRTVILYYQMFRYRLCSVTVLVIAESESPNPRFRRRHAFIKHSAQKMAVTVGQTGPL